MVSIIPASDPFGGNLAQNITSAAQLFARNRMLQKQEDRQFQRQQQQQEQERERQRQSLLFLGQQLGLTEEELAQFTDVDPNIALKALELNQKGQIKQQQNQLLQQFLGQQLNPLGGTLPEQVAPNELTPEQGIDTELDVSALQEAAQTPQGFIPLQGVQDREQLRQSFQQNASKIIAFSDVLGPQNAKMMLDMNQKLFESRDKELDNVEKEGLKLKTEAAQRFAKKADELTDSALKSQNIKLALEPIRDAISTGQSGPTLKNLLAEAAQNLPEGKLSGALKNMLITPAQQVFKVGQGSFFKTLKESFGANVSTRETELFMASLFQFATDPDAQQYAVEYQDILADRTIQASEIMNNLLDQNGVPLPNARQRFDREMKKVLQDGEKKLQQTNWWKKTNIKKLQQQAVSTQKKRDFLRKQIGSQ